MENESPMSIALLTPNLAYARVNKTLCNLIGLDKKDIIGKRCYKLITPPENDRNLSKNTACDYCASLRAMQTDSSAEMIQEFSKDFVAHVLAYPLKNAEGKIIGTMELMENIADKVNDPLTGCKNYRFFEESMSQECYKAVRSKANSALIILDLDNFKQVNDMYGHIYGDTILSEVAGILSAGLRKSDRLCRIGGDEFAIILPETNSKYAAQVAKRLKSSIEKTFAAYELSFCYGIACIPKDGEVPAVIKEVADSKLYKQKDSRCAKRERFKVAT